MTSCGNEDCETTWEIRLLLVFLVMLVALVLNGARCQYSGIDKGRLIERDAAKEASDAE